MHSQFHGFNLLIIIVFFAVFFVVVVVDLFLFALERGFFGFPAILLRLYSCRHSLTTVEMMISTLGVRSIMRRALLSRASCCLLAPMLMFTILLLRGLGSQLPLCSRVRSLCSQNSNLLLKFSQKSASSRSSEGCLAARKGVLMLLSSIHRDEVCVSKSAQVLDVVSKKVDESSKLNKDNSVILEEESQDVESDGYLTRCLEGKKATDIRLAAMAVGTASRGGLGKLMIRGSNSTRGVTKVGLSAIAHGCPSLRVLSLWNVAAIGDEGLIEIAKGCNKIEKLDLCQCPSISNKGLIAIAENCPNLTSLTIESCSNIGSEGLQAIGQRCSNLQFVSIKECPLVGDQGVASLVSSTSNVLKKVKLQSLNITDVSLAVIGHYCRSLTDLVLTGLQKVSERGFWVMGSAFGLQKVKSFTITSCRGMTDVALEAVGKGCPNLKQLCVRKCCFLSDSGMVAFSKSATALESLLLEECNRITQAGVLGALSSSGVQLKSLSIVKCLGIRDYVSGLAVLSPCKSLRSLTIRDCPGFGSAGLAMVGQLCPQLQHADLSGLSGVTDAGFFPMIENSEAGLVKVNLNGCVGITDAVVSTLARLHGETLQVLSLDGCNKITDASVFAIAENCPVLRDLDVSMCAITDAGVAALALKKLELQILSLSGCSKITAQSVPYLANMGQTLVGLNLQHCNSISSSMIEMLMECLWRCDILS